MNASSQLKDIKLVSEVVTDIIDTDYTAFEVFPTDKVIPAGTVDSLEGLSALFDWDISDENIINQNFTNETYSQDVEVQNTITLQFFTNTEKSGIKIDWGDGNIEDFENVSFEKYKTYYRGNLTHTYNNDAINRKLIVKIFGNTYFMVRNHINPMISRIFDKDLPISQNLLNISSLCANSKRLLKVDVAYGFNFKSLNNISSLFKNCSNLLSVNWSTGFTRMLYAFSYIYQNCVNLRSDVNDLLVPMYNWSYDCDFTSIFSQCRNVVGTINPLLLWDSPLLKKYKDKTITASAFSDCDNIKDQVPVSWGGTKKSQPSQHTQLNVVLNLSNISSAATITVNSLSSSFEKFTIDWGDGYIDEYDGSTIATSKSHVYAFPGIYEMKIYDIEQFAFTDANSRKYITSIQMSDGMTLVKNGLQATKITSIEFPNSTTSYISLPQGLLFNNGQLTTVKLNSNIQEIGINTFEFCTALQKITIPAATNLIQNKAFNACSALTSLTFVNKNELEIKAMDNYSSWFGTSTTQRTIYWSKMVDSEMTYGSFNYIDNN